MDINVPNIINLINYEEKNLNYLQSEDQLMNNKTNWFSINYISFLNNFSLRMVYNSELITIKNYCPMKTIPYDFDIIKDNINYDISINDNFDEFKNYYIKINNTNVDFSSEITIQIFTTNNQVIKKNIIIHFKNDNLYDIENITFDNLTVDNILYKNSIIGTLQNYKLNYIFNIDNDFIDLIKINNSVKLILKNNINKINDEFIDITLNILYKKSETISIQFYKDFKIIINKIYKPLVKIDQNYYSYINTPCWITYDCNNSLDINISIFKKNNNLLQKINSNLISPLFIPTETGDYIFVINTFFDKIESDVIKVIDKSVQLQIVEQLFGCCASNQI